jgi:hypothetical protein
MNGSYKNRCSHGVPITVNSPRRPSTLLFRNPIIGMVSINYLGSFSLFIDHFPTDFMTEITDCRYPFIGSEHRIVVMFLNTLSVLGRKTPSYVRARGYNIDSKYMISVLCFMQWSSVMEIHNDRSKKISSF